MIKEKHTAGCRNRGSAVIEMTLLIPIILICIYFYIMVFIHFVNGGKAMEKLSVILYEEQMGDTGEKGISVKKTNKKKTVLFKKQDRWFTFSIELKGNEDDSVEQIRRWQLAAELF